VPRMYDKSPFVAVSADSTLCLSGWEEIGRALRERAGEEARAICVECYPGVFTEQLQEELAKELHPSRLIFTEDFLLPAAELNRVVEPFLTDDPVFGILNDFEMENFFDREKFAQASKIARGHRGKRLLVVGPGAALLAPPKALLIYADLARWEIQQRQRRAEIGNLGAENQGDTPARKYKRAFFLDWRAADRLKRRLLPRMDFLLNTNQPSCPKMIAGDLLLAGLEFAASRPFRVVPFFDPGPWGGHWMEEVCNLPTDTANHAWCFDCVPEENSLVLGFGERRIEMPALNLVFAQPRRLLGDAIYERFGAEFPIRFDFLDTMGGGNLSLQVHPLAQYARARFGQMYTQDESYYMLDAEPDSCVYLGLKEGIDPAAMKGALEIAQAGGSAFDTERFVNRWPATRHDHFLIPAGTVHCSGKNSMVLEISSTSYIFTFKLWDWGRMGMDGAPRPIHLQRGFDNIQWDRTTNWVKASLINRVEELSAGDGWREERTGLHELEFIETRRHWFTGSMLHDTKGTLNVLNLVEGDEIVVESPEAAFEPFIVHYAETFVVPACVGEYRISPVKASGKPLATIKAFVRSGE